MILPNRTYLVTRRCAQQQFLLRPDKEVNQIFEFCLAYAANKYEIGLIAWLAMSNHYHAVVHDPDGKVCDFIEYFHKLLSNVLNAKWERRDAVFAAEETCLTHLEGEGTTIEKMAYTLANPVKANLVEKTKEWPGASSLRFADGKTRTIERPDFYFSKSETKKSAVDETTEMSTIVPPGMKMTRDELMKAVSKRVAELEAEAAQRRSNRRVLGIAAILATRHTQTPKKKKDGEREKSKLRPCVACGDEKKRIALLLLVKEFRIHHRAAREELPRNPDALFPKGTLPARSGQRPRKIGKRPRIDEATLQKHITRLH